MFDSESSATPRFSLFSSLFKMDPTMFNAGSAGGRRLCIDSACKETSRCLFINTNKALQRCLWGPGISSVVWLLLLCPVAWRCELFSLFIYCGDFEPALKFHISYHLAMSHTKSNTKTQTKTNTKCFKDSPYAVFLCSVALCSGYQIWHSHVSNKNEYANTVKHPTSCILSRKRDSCCSSVT